MGENSAIEWTTHSFNAWVGCTKVSPACDFCYAESWAKRTGHPELWSGDRRRTAAANWQKPHKWNLQAAAVGERHRVFCCSLADVFDNQVPAQWRHDLWHMIQQTPHLDWLLLTKRPQNIAKMLPDPETGTNPWGEGWPNVWLGMTAENQTEYDRRIRALLDVPAWVRFLSCEPLLGPIDLNLKGGIDWVIAGAESGSKARPMATVWAHYLLNQCKTVGTSFFMKQMVVDGKLTKNIDEFPDDLRVREYPHALQMAA